ncbi:unnamed protein product [Paramecium sonneborni]|uniref:Uncharacterized protein n=1 Tax=Paramecium sonneborni TaxID=65129 RepID=A0A8S1RT67_9CILI|nr:unnamed protein product [Paramecium sonneborni]CAD8130648.1 unnamed protein product [Paramecium sonneborni]
MIHEQEHIVTLIINQPIEMGEFGIQEAIQLFELFGLPYQELFRQYFPIIQFAKNMKQHLQLYQITFVDVQLIDLDLIPKVLNRSILMHDILQIITLQYIQISILHVCVISPQKKIREKNFARNYELNNRIYLGPVSLAQDLAFLMANQALVQENNLVFDSFAGKDSPLVACSNFGAICFGSKIYGNLIKGHCIGYINKKSTYLKDPNYKQVKPYINLNFQQYNLSIPNFILLKIIIQINNVQTIYQSKYKQKIKIYINSTN